MVYIIPNFLVLHFGENFMKIRTKIAKLQMPENLYKNVNENIANFHEFLRKAIKATNALHCLCHIYFLIHLKWLSIFF